MRQKGSMKIIDSFDSINERMEKVKSFNDHAPKYWHRGKELNPNDNVCIVKTTLPTEMNGFSTPAGEGVPYKEWMHTHNLVTTVGDQYYAAKVSGRNAAGTTYPAAASSGASFASDGIYFDHDGSTTAHNATANSILYGCMVLRNGSAVTPLEGHDYSDVVTALASGTQYRNTTKILRSNYPRFADNDADNTATTTTAMVTWSYSWAIGDFNTNLSGGTTDLRGGCIVDRAQATYSGVNAKLLTHFSFTGDGFEKTDSDTLKIFVNHTFAGA
jgi:hypothetical protein